MKRFLCRVLGHHWRVETRGQPAVPSFLVCFRCGKWVRPPKPLEAP